MDIDAILARRPALVLVDELAHTNAPGSRHPKRYLDVQEILTRGIDVYTTLNIQHVESLNDVVAQITRVRVRETVPDSIIDQADDIEIIDLTPDDLIKRLKEGKVYFPNTAQRAVENYFSPGNLTALRELALRRTAQRVDEQLLNHMQSHAIPGPWAAGERVLVCVDAHPGGASLVRYARRLADRLRAPWTALHVDTPRSAAMSEEDKDRLAATLAPGRAARRRGDDHSGPERRPGHRALRDGQQLHPYRRRQADPVALARTDRGLAHLRSDPQCRRHQRPCHFGNRARQRGGLAERQGGATSSGSSMSGPISRPRPSLPARSASPSLLDQFLDVRNLALVFLMAC